MDSAFKVIFADITDEKINELIQTLIDEAYEREVNSVSLCADAQRSAGIHTYAGIDSARLRQNRGGYLSAGDILRYFPRRNTAFAASYISFQMGSMWIPPVMLKLYNSFFLQQPTR